MTTEITTAIVSKTMTGTKKPQKTQESPLNSRFNTETRNRPLGKSSIGHDYIGIREHIPSVGKKLVPNRAHTYDFGTIELLSSRKSGILHFWII